jgi:hypothetical protein
MNSVLWLAAGIAGMLPVRQYPNTQDELAMPNGRGSNSTVTGAHPNFIDLPEQGFSIAAGSPCGFICLNNLNESQELPNSAAEDKKYRTKLKSEETQRKKRGLITTNKRKFPL